MNFIATGDELLMDPLKLHPPQAFPTCFPPQHISYTAVVTFRSNLEYFEHVQGETP